MHSTMMHYRPWPQYQPMLIEQHPYYQFVTHDMHLQYNMNDHQEDEYEQSGDGMPSEISDDQNHNADIFRLAFAASQWSKLVLNAEGLFNKLMSTNALPSNEQNLLKNQIEQWLCMKQEYEECIVGDESVSLHGYPENVRRSLERIEEVTETTETDERTDESNNWACKQMQIRNKSCSSSSLNTSTKSESYDSATDVTDDSDQSDVDSENSDFIDKLEECMKKFEIDTDDIVDSMTNDTLKSNNNLPEDHCLQSGSSISENNFNSSNGSPNNYSSKNNSPEPQSDASNNVATNSKSGAIRKQSARRTSILPYSEVSDELAEFQKKNYHSNNINLQKDNDHELISLDTFDSSRKTETQTNHNCADTSSVDINLKSGSIKVDSSSAIDSEHLNTLKTLRINIIGKQSEVKKIQFNLSSLRSQIEDKQTAIEKRKYFIKDMKQNLATRNTARQKYREWQRKYEEKYSKYEKLLKCKKLQRNAIDNGIHNKEMEKYKQLMMRCEMKIKSIKSLKQIVDDSTKKLASSEAYINNFKKEIDILKLRLKNEEKLKEAIDNEIIDCQKKVKQLEEVYNLTPANLKKILSASEDGKNLKIKVKGDANEHSVEMNMKSLSINDSVKDKSNSKNADVMDEKESLRKEIRDLRHIRDCVIKVQCDTSSAKMTPTTKVERQMLHLNEFIECIDAMIEEKNVMICSKADLNQNRTNKLDEHIPVFARLEKLSHKELVTLFYKYFYKVIDLKDSGQNLEIQNAILENNIKKLEMNYEERLMDLEKHYERNITMLLSCYPDESGSSVCDSRIDKSRDVVHLMKENQNLRQRLAYFDSLLKADKFKSIQTLQSHSNRNTRQVLKPQLMQATTPPRPVFFRQKNKLIIQTYNKK